MSWLEAIGGALGGALGARERNAAAAGGGAKESVLAAMMAGAGGDEAMKRYREQKDEREFLNGAAEELMNQADAAGLNYTKELENFHGASLGKQRAVVSGLATRLKQYEQAAAERDTAGFAKGLAEALNQGPTLEQQQEYWSSTRNEMPSMPKRELTAQDIMKALAANPRAATGPNLGLVERILAAQEAQQMTPYQRATLGLKAGKNGQEVESGTTPQGVPYSRYGNFIQFFPNLAGKDGPVRAQPVEVDGKVIGHMVGERFVGMKGDGEVDPTKLVPMTVGSGKAVDGVFFHPASGQVIKRGAENPFGLLFNGGEGGGKAADKAPGKQQVNPKDPLGLF